MEYRKLPHGQEQISIIGLGNSSLGPCGEEEMEKTVAMAIENGVNYFDTRSRVRIPLSGLWTGCFRVPQPGVFSGAFWSGLSKRQIRMDPEAG